MSPLRLSVARSSSLRLSRMPRLVPRRFPSCDASGAECAGVSVLPGTYPSRLTNRLHGAWPRGCVEVGAVCVRVRASPRAEAFRSRSLLRKRRACARDEASGLRAGVRRDLRRLFGGVPGPRRQDWDAVAARLATAPVSAGIEPPWPSAGSHAP